MTGELELEQASLTGRCLLLRELLRVIASDTKDATLWRALLDAYLGYTELQAADVERKIDARKKADQFKTQPPKDKQPPWARWADLRPEEVASWYSHLFPADREVFLKAIGVHERFLKDKIIHLPGPESLADWYASANELDQRRFLHKLVDKGFAWILVGRGYAFEVITNAGTQPQNQARPPAPGTGVEPTPSSGRAADADRGAGSP